MSRNPAIDWRYLISVLSIGNLNLFTLLNGIGLMQFRVDFVKGWVMHCPPTSSCICLGDLKIDTEAILKWLCIHTACQNQQYLPGEIKNVNIASITYKGSLVFIILPMGNCTYTYTCSSLVSRWQYIVTS